MTGFKYLIPNIFFSFLRMAFVVASRCSGGATPPLSCTPSNRGARALPHGPFDGSTAIVSSSGALKPAHSESPAAPNQARAFRVFRSRRQVVLILRCPSLRDIIDKETYGQRYLET